MNNEKSNLKTGTCFFGHKWTKWVAENVAMMYIIRGKELSGYDTIQTRKCLRCGKVEKETI